MAEDPTTGLNPDEDPGDPKDPNEDPDTGTEDAQDTPPEDKPEQDPEVKKAFQRRDAAVKARQKAEEELKALREKYEPKADDPEKRANRKLVTAEARMVLTEAGVSKDDHAAVIEFLNLDDVPVDSDGSVDADVITERVEKLARIFGKGAPARKAGPRVDTRDRGGERAKPADAAAARRREMLGL